MAKESVELPLTPEESKSCTVEMRRYSAGKASSGISNEKIVPHYLRASTGSCHDFCKYGREHAFEVKERRSIPNRATRKQLHRRSEESMGGIMTSVARLTASVDSNPTKKMSAAKLMKSLDSKPQISGTSDASKQELPTKSSDSKKQIRNEGVVYRNKASSVKVKSSLMKSHTSPSLRHEVSSTSKEVESPSKSTSRKEETPSKSTSKKVETPSKSTSKVKTSSKSTSKMAETSSKSSSLKGRGMESSEKCVTSLNPNCVIRKTISSMNSSEGFGGTMNSEIKMEKGAAFSKATSRKLIAPIRASLSSKPSLKRVTSLNSRKHKSLKIVSHLKNQKTANARKVEPEECDDNEVEEKTLYVIQMESENKTLQSGHSASCDDESALPQVSSPKLSSSSTSHSLSKEGQEESEYSTSEFEEDSFSGNHEVEYMENEDMLEVVGKGKPRKDGVVYSEDRDCQMLKLKFRRGKIIENKIENNSPRRLKFRRSKVLWEKANVKADAQRKSFKRDGTCADGTGATTGPEKVVLRHQDMEDKKDAQGLFNNVIEETASKLVETRKSKVKALVGAFETVISLQEKKPSANTVI